MVPACVMIGELQVPPVGYGIPWNRSRSMVPTKTAHTRLYAQNYHRKSVVIMFYNYHNLLIWVDIGERRRLGACTVKCKSVEVAPGNKFEVSEDTSPPGAVEGTEPLPVARGGFLECGCIEVSARWTSAADLTLRQKRIRESPCCVCRRLCDRCFDISLHLRRAIDKSCPFIQLGQLVLARNAQVPGDVY